MPDEQDDDPEYTYPGGCINPYTEALVVQQVLGHLRGYPLSRLRRDLDDLDPEWLEDSIESLKEAGVVLLKRTRIHMSPPVRRLDALDMITI
jgi:hypothetical protein